MLIIAGTITVNPDEREAFLTSRRGTVAKARAQQGCIEYAFSADAVDPACVRLFERWETEEDVDAWLRTHRAEPDDPEHPKVPVKAMHFLRHQISSTEPV
jgi:quinol monooxygenase YgiN